VANPDSGVVEQWDSITIPVLANDTDPDGDTLSVISATYNSTYVQVTRVQAVANGPFIYLDVVGITQGVTRINYTVSDGRGGQAVGAVDVTITRGAGLQ
jgi:hypothetical protein